MKENIPKRLAVLISGNGTNLQAIIDACASHQILANVVVVISNNGGAYGLERARRAGIPTIVKVKSKNQDRRSYDAELSGELKAYLPDWVVLAGWMRILTSEFLMSFPNRVVNIHPALPGTFPGTGAIERAYEAFQNGLITETGVMVHLVPDEGVDCGPVLNQQSVFLVRGETLESLEARIHEVEHALLVRTLAHLCENPLVTNQN